MNQKISKLMLAIKITSGIGIMGLVGCAHELSPVQISSSANPTAEIAHQRELMTQSYESQVDVLAPDEFQKAEKYLVTAQKENTVGADSQKLLEAVGRSKAYLEKANIDAAAVRSNLTDVAEARTAATVAGARNLPNELEAVDKKLKKISSDPADISSVKTEDKVALQSEYLRLELLSIKDTKLKETQTILAVAKKKGAEKITPVAYKAASEKLVAAEKVIETDRHSSAKINPAVFEASESAHRVLSLLESEQSSRKQSPEQRAITLEGRNQAVKEADMATRQANQVTQEVVAESTIKDQILTNQAANLAASEMANDELKKKEQDELVVTNAAALFDKSEADVYRQEGNLVIRLKKMNFATSRSDLPSDSLAVLTKVKEVMKKVGPGDVMVEGHTDGVGSASKNQTLSEKRAQAVVKYFESDSVLSSNKIGSVGFGYSKPLATNKTKEGRAQNRRVDIIIKTL